MGKVSCDQDFTR